MHVHRNEPKWAAIIFVVTVEALDRTSKFR